MMEQKGGRLAGILFAAELADPVAYRSITYVVALSHFLHGPVFHKYGAKCFVTSMRRLHGMNKKTLVLASVHDHLPAKLSSI